MAVKPNIDDYKFTDYRNPDAFIGGKMPERGTYRKALKSVADEIEHLANVAKKTYWGNTPAYDQFRIELDHNIWNHSSIRDFLSVHSNSDIERQPELLQAINDVRKYGRDLLDELKPLTQWNGKEWVEPKNESLAESLNKTVKLAESSSIDMDEVKKEIPKLMEFEWEYWAQISGEVGGRIDYRDGGIYGERYVRDEDNAYITLEHPFVKGEDGKYHTIEDEWQISTYWSGDHFEVSSKQKVTNIQQVYDFIQNLPKEFDEFE